MKRYEDLWRLWDAEVRLGATARDVLVTTSDADLVKLLATAPEHRRYERNIISTELLNRIERRPLAPALAHDVEALRGRAPAEAAYEAVGEAVRERGVRR